MLKALPRSRAARAPVGVNTQIVCSHTDRNGGYDDTYFGGYDDTYFGGYDDITYGGGRKLKSRKAQK